MATVEYIAKIKGDTSSLEAALQKAEGRIQRLNDDEVIVKLNYDGNIKAFNREFDKVAKACPELGIQFQYNVNKKMLDQEMQKLQDMSVDISLGNAKQKLNDLADLIREANKAWEDAETDDEMDQYGRQLSKLVQKMVNYRSALKDMGVEGEQAYGALGKDIKEIVDEITNMNDLKPSFNMEGIQKQREVVKDLEDELGKLRELGAVDMFEGADGKVSELKDDIRILKADIEEIRTQMDGASGNMFDEMQRQVDDLNEKLSDTLDKLARLQDPNGYSLGNTVSGWQNSMYEGEHYTPFNSRTLQVSDQNLVGEEENITGKLVRMAIENAKIIVDSFIHTHPMQKAAFSDADLEMYFALLQEGITKQVVASVQEAMELDMGAVDTSKASDILRIVREKYEEIDQELWDQYKQNSLAELSEIGNTVISGVQTGNPALQKVIEEIHEKFNKLCDDFGYDTLQDYGTAIDEMISETLYSSNVYKNSSNDIQSKLKMMMGSLADNIVEPVGNIIGEQAQAKYQEVLVEVFSNPEFLKSGVKSAIQVHGIDDFIDFSSIKDAATKSVKAAKDAIKDAQDSASPAEESRRLGNDWGDGYIEGIRDKIGETEAASAELAEAAKRGLIAGNAANPAEFTGDAIEVPVKPVLSAGYTWNDLVGHMLDDTMVGIEVSPMLDPADFVERIEERCRSYAARIQVEPANEYSGDGDFSDGFAKDLNAKIQIAQHLTGQLKDVLDLSDAQSSLYEIVNLMSQLPDVINSLYGDIERMTDSLNRSVSLLAETKAEVGRIIDGEVDALNRIAYACDAVYESVSTLYKSIPESAGSISVDTEGIDKLNAALNELRDENIENKLTKIYVDLDDFAKAISSIKIDDTTFLASIDKVLSKGEELKNLAKIVSEGSKNVENAAKSAAPKDDGMTKLIQEKITMLDGLRKKIEDTLDIKGEGLSDKFKSEITSTLDSVNAKIDELRLNGKDILNTDEGLKSVRNLEVEAKKSLANIEKAAKDVSIAKLDGQIVDFLTKNTKLSKKFRDELDALRQKLNAGGLGNSDLADIRREFEEIVASAKEAGDVGKSTIDTISHRLDDMNAKFIAQYFSWQDILRYIRETAQTVIELDSALTELRKVSDASTERLAQSFQTSAESAKDLGSTISDVINITADWSRLGYDVDQAEELARVTTLFKTVGDNMTADDASSYMVSTLQGFQMATDQAQEIVDKYNEVANNFAIDTAGIGESLKRSAASFNAANTDLSKSIALVTATNEVVQNPEAVGKICAYRHSNMTI